MRSLFLLLLSAASVLLTACAATGGKTGGSGGREETARLESLRPGLSTPEDSLVLDLLIGYETLLPRSEDADPAEAASLRQARNAARQLEYMLRYGGIVDRGRGERILTLPDGTRLTLQEAVAQLSRALLRTGKGGDWEPATARAHEIQRHKPDLAALVEDANWVLALSAALDGALPDDLKKQLRRLQESYARGASHEEITRQVNDLLPKVKDDALRRELKKLANRSWDRDQRAGIAPVVGATGGLSLPPNTPAAEASDSITAPSLKESQAAVDSLASHGRYIEALHRLEAIEDQVDAKWIADRRQNLGNHYCEDRRNAAAAAFIAGRKAGKDSVRVRYLRQSLSDLDSCLFQFPEAAAAAKVRRNRTLVQKELSH